MRESNVWKRMLLAAGQIQCAAVRIFRNNTAMGWSGKSVRITPDNRHMVALNPGDVVVRSANPLHAGLIRGSADGIGWSTVEITPDMVGRRIAVFTSTEAKRSNGGRVSEDQQKWHANVQSAGGISVIVRDPDDLRYAVESFISQG